MIVLNDDNRPNNIYRNRFNPYNFYKNNEKEKVPLYWMANNYNPQPFGMENLSQKTMENMQYLTDKRVDSNHFTMMFKLNCDFMSNCFISLFKAGAKVGRAVGQYM
ncbi:hypothetical protein [Veronia pacifica]|uniref:Uncharacterized protein n=1 Tax=Veronia pacifica TaxID=1080227 RepID=A0A1C3ELC6_9GAMM|nr:hypothetical protein [Veronia pacifica]ODA34038.1 hypothetical protein A8L45_08315 [Veronia pacifica]